MSKMKIGYVKEKRQYLDWCKINQPIRVKYKNVTTHKYGYIILSDTLTIKFIKQVWKN